MSKKTIWIITLFPEMFYEFFNNGVIGRALREREKFQFEVRCLNPSEFSLKGRKGVDDAPYGGGPGMVLKADVLSKTLNEGVFSNYLNEKCPKVIFPNPRGEKWNNNICRSFASNYLVEGGEDLVFIAGRYEGIDERFIEKYVDLEYSIGDYVLTGGELAIMAMLDSSFRFVPDCLGNSESANNDSFEKGLIDSPKYTRPLVFEGMGVPEILLSGNHQKISLFNQEEREKATIKDRDDLKG